MAKQPSEKRWCDAPCCGKGATVVVVVTMPEQEPKAFHLCPKCGPAKVRFVEAAGGKAVLEKIGAKGAGNARLDV